MAVRANKSEATAAPKSKSRLTRKDDPNSIKTEADAEAWILEVENDPNASPLAKELVAFIRDRAKSGVPYLTIEQIMAELGR